MADMHPAVFYQVEAVTIHIYCDSQNCLKKQILISKMHVIFNYFDL